MYHVSMSVWLRITAFLDLFVRSKLGNGRFVLVLVMNWYTSDSKTNPWDDPEIYTGSCSEDQTVIQIQNCVISCDCLLLYHFLISHCQYYLYVTCIVSFGRLIYFISMITRTISYDISDRTPYVFSWYEHLLMSFHVLKVRRC